MSGTSLLLFKSIAVGTLLVGWYLLALRHKKQHAYNRFYLLFTLYACLQFPFLQFQWFQLPGSKSAPLAFAPVLQAVSDYNTHSMGSDAGSTPTSAGTLVAYLVAIISLLLLSSFALKIGRVLRLAKKYPSTFHDGLLVINTDLPQAPFSFFNYLFWKNTISLDSEEGKAIFRHEAAHIRLKHSYDRVVCQLLTSVFWFHPIFWIIQKELKVVHEFMADEQAVTDGDPETLAKMLLYTHNNGSYIMPVSQFFSSPIKRRIMMLQTTKSRKMPSLLAKLVLAPLTAGALLLFSFTTGAGYTAPDVPDARYTIVIDPGHGGNDEGCSKGNLVEKELNLKIARRLQTIAASYHIKAYLTRDGDQYMSLKERVAAANSKKPDCFLSVHIDDAQGQDQMKSSMAIAVNTKNKHAEQSEKLAVAIYRQLMTITALQPSAPADVNVAVLRDNNSPALLLELGDIKNKQHMAQLTDPQALDVLCHELLKGVVAGLGG